MITNTKIAMQFLVPWTICFKMPTLFFKKSADNFEIAHKTCLFQVAKRLFHQSPTRRSDYTVKTTVTM